MVENKTTATGANVENHIATIANEKQRNDCEILLKLLRKITKQEVKM